jgi:hypothetical protein
LGSITVEDTKKILDLEAALQLLDSNKHAACVDFHSDLFEFTDWLLLTG